MKIKTRQELEAKRAEYAASLKTQKNLQPLGSPKS